MAFPILGSPKPQFFDSSGDPLVNGTLSVLEPTNDSNKTYYPTADDANAATNGASGDITLNSRGEPTNALFGISGQKYKCVLKDSSGTTIWTVDDIRFENDGIYSSAGVLRVQSYTDGAIVYGDATTGRLYVLTEVAGSTAGEVVWSNTSSYFGLISRVNGNTLNLYATNGAGSATNPVFVGDPDAGVSLYYAGSAKLATSSTGAAVTGSTLTLSSKPGTYTPTNVTTDRTYDANATSTDELADILGTLIADLQAIGLIG